VFVGHNFGVLHLTDPIEKFKEIAFGRIEREVADVKTRRGHFDGFGLAGGTDRSRRSITTFRRAVAGDRSRLRGTIDASEEGRDFLP
jgi:hypothetical protein